MSTTISQQAQDAAQVCFTGGSWSRRELEHAIQQAIDSASKPLVWSSVKPTLPGWYWHKSVQGHIHTMKICQGDLGWGSFDGQFAGPLPQPVEEKP